MKVASMREHLRDRMYEVSPELFEILCKMVLTRRLNADTLQVTAFRQDDGIDIEGIINEDVFSAMFGVQVKRYDQGNTVGSGYVQRFSGALNQANHQIGTYITSSSFTQPAKRTAEDLQIHLMDGNNLARTMIDYEIGVEETRSGYDLREEFWQALEEPERKDTVPSNEVPLANSFESLRRFLEAIEETDGSKREIQRKVPEFEPRHADLYGTAGWLLGFVHKDTPKEINGREVRCWGLTKTGVEYLRLHGQGETEIARERLIEAVRQVEIINRVLDKLKEEGELTYDEIKDTLSAETMLSESSVSRRSSTIVQWLTILPEIEEVSVGSTKKFVLTNS